MQGYLKYSFLFLCFAFEIASAQEVLVVGGGPSIELENSLYGINGRLFYGPNERFCFGPEVTYFPYQEIDEENELSVIDLNVNAHYFFELAPELEIYPLTGVNFTIEQERLLANDDEVEEESDFGINYGIGIHYNFGKLYVFSEFKGILGKLNDEFITVGVLFSLKSHAKEEHAE